MKWENFTVSKEYLGVELKAIHGSIPQWLKGTYYKVGPAWRNPGEVKHILDGDGYMTKVNFASGKALFDGKYIADTRNTKGPNAFGGPMLSMVPLKNKMNTNLLSWNNELIAFYEGCPPMNISSGNVWGPYKHGLPMKGLGGNAVNAHFKLDANILHILDVQYGIGFGLGTWMKWRSYDWKEQLGEVCLYIPHFVYLHDWGMTRDYYVFIYHPLSVSLKEYKKGIASNLKQNQKQHDKAIVYVISKKDGRIVKQAAMSDNDIFTTHFTECTQDDQGGICIKAIAYKSIKDVETGKSFQISLDLHMESDKVIRMDKHSYMLEFPSQHFATFGRINHPLEGIIRLRDDACLIYDRNAMFGEPIELYDGRYVMFFSVKHDEFQRPLSTTLWVCDAEDLNVVCILAMPDPYVSLGLHGIWIEDKI